MTSERLRAGLDPDSVEAFAQDLTTARQEAGLSIRAVGRRSGIPTATLGDYFSGRHLPPANRLEVLDQVLQALGVPRRAWPEWRRRLTDLHESRRQVTVSRQPYPGLRSYQAEDHDLFFGRERLIDRLVGMVQDAMETRDDPFVAVVGTSGAGKSSLLHAGLLSALAGVGVPCAVVTPERILALDEQSRPEVEVESLTVLVVDQLEEVWTSGQPTAAQQLEGFLGGWVRERPGRAVVLGLRADFYGAATGVASFSRALQDRQLVVGPMDSDGLRAAIEGPARRVGLSLEPGLVELLLSDIQAHRMGSLLPHLSHVLQTMFEASNRRALTVADYRETGGFTGAIRASAEGAMAELGPQDQEVARDLLLRMVTVLEGQEPTRRVVPLSELGAQSGVTQDVLRLLVSRHLVTLREDDAGLSHEALLVAWPRLRDWVVTERADLASREELERNAQSWEAQGRGEDHLLRGTRLATVLDWSGRRGGWLTPLQSDYLLASSALAEREERERAALQRRRRVFTAVVTILALLTTAASVIATTGYRTAVETRDEALARQIAARSLSLRDINPALSQQLAVAGFRTSPTAESRAALLDATTSTVLPPWSDGDTVLQRTTTLGDGEHVLLAGRGGEIVIARPAGHGLEVVGRTVVTTATGGPVEVTRVERHPQQHWIVTGGSFQQDGELPVPALHLVDVSDPTQPRAHALPAGSVPTALAFLRGGSILAVGTLQEEEAPDGQARQRSTSVQLYSVGESPSGWAPIGGPTVVPHPIESLDSDEAGSVLGAALADGSLRVWDVVDEELRHVRRLTVDDGLFDLDVTADGTALAAVGRTGRVHWVEIGDATLEISGDLVASDTDLHTVVVDEARGMLATAGVDGRVSLWSLVEGQRPEGPPHHVLPTSHPVLDLAPTDVGTWVFTTQGGPTYAWDTHGPLLPRHGGNVFIVGSSQGGSRLMTSTGPPDSAVYIWDGSAPHAPELVHRLAAPGDGIPFTGAGALSRDGSLAGGGTNDGRLVIWRIDRPEPDIILDQHVAESGIVFTMFTPDHSRVVITSRDGTMRVIGLEGEDLGRTLGRVAISEGMLSAAVTSEGIIAVSDESGSVRLVDVEEPGDQLAVIELGSDVYGLDFSPDGTTLALSAIDHRIYLYDVSTPADPRPIGNLAGPTTPANTVKYAPDGTRLAVAATGGQAWLYTQNDGRWEPTEVLRAGLANLQDLAWSADGSVLLGGALAGHTRLWLTDPEAAVRVLCEQSGPPMTQEEWEAVLPGTDYRPPCSD